MRANISARLAKIERFLEQEAPEDWSYLLTAEDCAQFTSPTLKQGIGEGERVASMLQAGETQADIRKALAVGWPVVGHRRGDGPFISIDLGEPCPPAAEEIGPFIALVRRRLAEEARRAE